MKKIIILFLITIFIFLIYNLTRDSKIYYLNIGDGIALGKNKIDQNIGYDKIIIKYLKENNKFEKYNNTYTNINYRTTDLITMIKNNELYNNTTIQNDLIKADIITISLGINDLLPYGKNSIILSNEEIYELASDFDQLFSILRENSKEKIYFIGIYNPNLGNKYNNMINGLNSILKQKSIKYEITYIDIFNDMLEQDNLELNSIFPTEVGYKLISDKIIELLD